MEKRKNKALTILEFDKILNMLAEYTSNEAVKKQIFDLEPVKDMKTAQFLQKETTQAQTQLLKYGSPSNMAVPAVINSIRRCEVGGILSPRELLDIASVLYVARNTKSYLSSADEESQDILYSLASSLKPERMFEEQIKMCICT